MQIAVAGLNPQPWDGKAIMLPTVLPTLISVKAFDVSNVFNYTQMFRNCFVVYFVQIENAKW